jgi:hypothetical protein
MQFLLYTAIVVANFGVTAKGELEWSSDYGKAKAAAAAAQRPLLVVLENSNEQATQFDDKLFEAKEIKLIKQFQLCRVDVNTPYGKKVAEAFKVTKLPYTAITDKTAKYITFRGAGPMSREQWTEALETRKNGDKYPATMSTAIPATQAWPAMPMQSSCPSCVQGVYR